MSLSSTLGTYIAGNHTRTRVADSQFGTRRGQWYAIYIDGYSLYNEPGWDTEQSVTNGPDAWRVDFSLPYTSWDDYSENLESPFSMLYPIIRGITTQAEIFEVGFPTEVYGDSTILMVKLAQDTTMDYNQDFYTGNSESLRGQIAESIYDFNWNYVDVTPCMVYGDGFNYLTMGSALSSNKPTFVTRDEWKKNSTTKLAKADLGKKK